MVRLAADDFAAASRVTRTVKFFQQMRASRAALMSSNSQCTNVNAPSFCLWNA
jgi:hypothetical protein